MVLVDTAVWIDHFNVGVAELGALLEDGHVIGHTWVLGELLMGAGVPPDLLLAMRSLDAAPTLPDDVMLEAIDRWGWRGLSWVDLQLVLSANAAGCRLWTRGRAAARAASDLGVAHIEAAGPL